MSVLCLGLNHRTAPVELRERVAFRESEVEQALGVLTKSGKVAEAVVLSTCNRVEVYGVASGGAAADGLAEVKRYFGEKFGIDESAWEAFYEETDEGARRHLLKVVSGLDSMMLGETEIFGQVKKAYAVALEAGATSKVLNKLFQQAFGVGKLVRTSTQITHGATSVGAAAVDLAGKIFGDLKKCRVMIIGAGDMSRRCAMSLKSRGAAGVIVSNRSYDKAVELAQEMDGEAIHFDDWEKRIGDVDIVVSSTSAPHPVIHKGQVEGVMRKRRGMPLFVIDIAVPRDVEPEVGEVDGVYLYDIDTLEGIADDGRKQRAEQITLCEKIIDEELVKIGEMLGEQKREKSGGFGTSPEAVGGN